MNDPGNPEPPRAGTIAARFHAMRQDLQQVAQSCIRDGSYGCARRALKAAEAIEKVWRDFPIESEEIDWPWEAKDWTRDRSAES